MYKITSWGDLRDAELGPAVLDRECPLVPRDCAKWAACESKSLKGQCLIAVGCDKGIGDMKDGPPGPKEFIWR